MAPAASLNLISQNKLDMYEGPFAAAPRLKIMHTEDRIIITHLLCLRLQRLCEQESNIIY